MTDQITAPASEPHPDDAAVDRFATVMKEKLRKKRDEGRSGWDDKTACTAADLSRMLYQHVHRRDPVDVANFCMMLQQRGEQLEFYPTEFQKFAFTENAALPVDRASTKLAPTGWMVVPIEPDGNMVVAGFEAASKFEDTDEWEDLSGCQRAAKRARICYAAMLAAAPNDRGTT